MHPYAAHVINVLMHSDASIYCQMYLKKYIYESSIARHLHRTTKTIKNNFTPLGMHAVYRHFNRKQMFYSCAEALASIDYTNEWPRNCVSMVFVCIGINNIKKHKYLKLYYSICHRSIIIDLYHYIVHGQPCFVESSVISNVIHIVSI